MEVPTPPTLPARKALFRCAHLRTGLIGPGDLRRRPRRRQRRSGPAGNPRRAPRAAGAVRRVCRPRQVTGPRQCRPEGDDSRPLGAGRRGLHRRRRCGCGGLHTGGARSRRAGAVDARDVPAQHSPGVMSPSSTGCSTSRSAAAWAAGAGPGDGPVTSMSTRRSVRPTGCKSKVPASATPECAATTRCSPRSPRPTRSRGSAARRQRPHRPGGGWLSYPDLQPRPPGRSDRATSCCGPTPASTTTR